MQKREENKKKKKLWLTITGVQKGFGEELVSEITTSADYYTKGDTHYLFYNETTKEGWTVKNRLTMKPDVVELKKSGAGDSLLRFRLGHSEPCTYDSPAGVLQMVSETKKIQLEAEENLLLLKLEYSFYMSGMLVSEYDLTVKGKWIQE